LGSYRYAVANLGALSAEALFARFLRIVGQIDFHPRGQAPSEESALERSPGD
jgi:hypothetical protein